MVFVHIVVEKKARLLVIKKNISSLRLGSFFKNLGRIYAKAGKKLATNVLKNPGRALEITSNIATAAATKSTKATLSTLPEVMNFYHKGKGVYLGKFVYFVLYQWNKKLTDYTQVHH